MNAYSLKPIPILVEPKRAPDPAGLDGLPLTMAVDKCQRIIAGCIEAVKRATEPETPRLVLAR